MSTNSPTNSPTPHGARPLSTMQRKVARLCSLGCTVAEAAHILGLRPATVERHKALAMSRLGACNLATLTRHSLQEGVSDLADQLTPAEQQLLQEFGSRTAPE